MDARTIGRVAWNMRRVEAGLPWYGVDVTEENFPKEARLDGFVSYDKGCFLGQEPIARMHYRGHPNWLLVGLAAGDDAPATLAYPEHLERVKELPTLGTDADAVRADAAALAIDHAAGVELFTPDADDVHAIADEISEGGPTREGATPPKAVGRLTSGVLSPRLQRALFLGYVRATMAATGTKFRARVAGADLTLSIVELPLPGPIKGEKHA
jgi:folate-binding protein YgfZ